MRAMQDLVGVRVADAAEEMGIGERALEGVVLAPKAISERRRRCGERLEAARIQRGETGITNEVDARPLLRARLRENERSAVEVERREPELAWDRRACGLPTEPAGDHQMNDEVKRVVSVP